MLHFYNINGNEPLIYHCNGITGNKDARRLSEIIFSSIENNKILCPDNVTIIIADDNVDYNIEDRTKYNTLYNQIIDNNLPYINGFYTSDKLPKFKLLNKVNYIYNALQQVTTEYSLILDMRDVKIRTLDNIIELFKTYNTKILFGAEKNNFSIVYSKIEQNNKLQGSDMKYANTGTIIGYTKELTDFYKTLSDEILDKDIKHDNYIKLCKFNNQLVYSYATDQGFIREHFNNYTADYINVDYKSLIFMNTADADIYLN